MRAVVLALPLVLAACGDDARTAPDAGAGDAAPPAPDAIAWDARPDDAGACATAIQQHDLLPGTHVAACSDVSYPTNPPTSGPHYPLWARYQTYTAPVPRGFYVHDLEHGAVVITYHCPDGDPTCATDLAALADFLAARPADPLCTAAVHHRVVVTPDPQLDVRFAASAWGWSLRSDCFDLEALGTFLDAHYAQAPENLCGDGIDPTVDGNGCP